VTAFRLIPKEQRFYADFEALADEIRRGSRLLEEMLAPDHPIWDKADEIKEVEHKCDFLTHQIFERLNRTFVTPIDREDIHGLASSLDNVMDAIDATAAVIRIYRIDRMRPGARELATIISSSADKICQAMRELERLSGVGQCAVEINRLENEGDRAHQRAVERLFAEERDPIEIIKWKEILDYLEDATDRCEDVANVLDAVVVKHG
jgi:predicted phosphate transport protein (TIGR00153 family)